jgi:spermidine synthase
VKHARDIPQTLLDGGAGPKNHGFVDGEWFFEDDHGSTRFGLHLEATLHEERSAFQKIGVYDTSYFGKLLTLDDIVMLTERDEFVYHEMIVHVPLCSIPEPRSVLIVGGGDCGTLREALHHPGIERVVQCEIDERVTQVCKDHFPWVRDVIADERAELVFGDGVKYVEGHRGQFDLIVIDGIDPKGFAVSLFLRDFYESVGRALKPGGVMTAQAESSFWSPKMVTSIFAELRAGFRHTAAYMSWIPTNLSGCWNMAYASNDRGHDDYFDVTRAAELASRCRYYNPDIHKAAFALPNFARDVVEGLGNPFAHLDERAAPSEGQAGSND